MTEISSNKTDEELSKMYQGQRSPFTLVLGRSGSGKSTSLRNFDSSNTVIINCMGKRLPFPKGVKYETDKNIFTISDPTKIKTIMREVSSDKKFSHIKNLIIDDGHYVMVNELLNKASEKGFDKFNVMASHMRDILTTASDLRGDLKVFMLAHDDELDNGQRVMLTTGKLVREKLPPASFCTIVLFSKVETIDKKKRYMFETQSDGSTCAKSPMDMFPENIPNDLELVSKRIDEYYQGVELKDSTFINDFSKF